MKTTTHNTEHSRHDNNNKTILFHKHPQHYYASSSSSRSDTIDFQEYLSDYYTFKNKKIMEKMSEQELGHYLNTLKMAEKNVDGLIYPLIPKFF
jgi:hypothetical protein